MPEDTYDAPTDNSGIFLYSHEHEWVRVGSKGPDAPTELSWWHPVYLCEVCTDVIYDIQVRLPLGQHCPEEGCIDRQGHSTQHFDGYNRKWD